MDTYEKKYNEALAKAREIKSKILSSHLSTESCKAVSEYIDEIIPELRESEDERIRKELIEHIKEQINSFISAPDCRDKYEEEEYQKYKSWIAYLEKQKEQKPALITERIRPKFAVGDTVCRPMWSEHTIREIYVRCNDPVYVCVNEEGTESHISFSEQDEWERKEQKPTEWSYPYGKNETVDRLVSIAECLEMNGDCVYNGYKGDECGVFLRALAREYLCIEELVNVVQDKNLMNILYYASSDDHFPSLRKLHTLLTSYNEQKEQKPVEWSEEDEKMLTRCCADIERVKNRLNVSDPETRDKEIEWLENRFKSLRPVKQEWSENDEKQLDDIISIIREAYEHGTTISETRHRNAYFWLNNLRPSWKPSEDQIEAVRYFVNRHQSEAWAATGQWKEFSALRGLLGILQKLM